LGWPVIYVSFDRSPKNLLNKLGVLAERPNLLILDCFTCGKGESSPVFMKFYDEPGLPILDRIKRVEKPQKMDHVSEALYKIHGQLKGNVGLIFESITGMQEVWGGEEAIVRFYSHSCPRLYELETVAYWVIEKLAHSQRLKARINQIAQVAIDLTIKRGTTSITILKAENRGTAEIDNPYPYWSKENIIQFSTKKEAKVQLNLGLRIKELRTKRGMSQTELAKHVGVTPSTISQVETNTIYPSVPALMKIAEILGVKMGYLFKDATGPDVPVVFPSLGGTPQTFSDLPKDALEGRLLTPPDLGGKMEPYLIEILPGAHLPEHFLSHKGEEMGYLLSGELEVLIKNDHHTVRAGDVVYLVSEIPAEWKNPGPDLAKLLWIVSK
jgi:transcriptional regulator with XRE-family HTH domain